MSKSKPRPKPLPSYRLHRPSGQAVVTLSGRDVYLGPHGSPESRSRYDSEVASWLARGRIDISRQGATVGDLAQAYSCHAETYYVKHGIRTAHGFLACRVARTVARLHGNLPAADFSVGNLIALRQGWIGGGLARKTVNQYIAAAREVFRWGVENALVPPAVLHGLAAVRGARVGRTKARETQPVGPVDRSLLRISRRHLPRHRRVMVDVQLLTGMRPNEIAGIKPCEVDRSADVWAYRPSWHKTEHKGKGRTILIGPRAQKLLAPYFGGDPGRLAFPKSPTGVKRDRDETPVELASSYCRAILRACERAFPPPSLPATRTPTREELAAVAEWEKDPRAWRKARRWTPNQLRHSAATKIRRRAGIESARIALGHSSVAMTEIYAEKDLDSIRELTRRIG